MEEGEGPCSRQEAAISASFANDGFSPTTGQPSFAAMAATARPLSETMSGAATLSVGTFEGGSGVNLVPDAARIGVDIRTLPGMDHGAPVVTPGGLLSTAAPESAGRRLGLDCGSHGATRPGQVLTDIRRAGEGGAGR